MGILIANIAVAGGCGIAIIAIITEHSQKMAKINAMTGGVSNANNSAPLEYIRREIAELRDTTTRYDMSFDSAL